MQPSYLSDLSSGVALGNFCLISSSELSAFTASPTGVSSIISRNGFIGLGNMTGEGSEELQSIELMCYLVFGGIGNDIILPAVAKLALAGPSLRRKCLDAASAKSGIESLSRASGPLSTCPAVASA